MLLPESLQSLINALERLPGIGPKSASRLAFYFLRAPEEVSQDLASALANLKANTTLREECFNITEAGRERCEICESAQRDPSLVCVVEEALDVLALERTGGYKGKYHVLQGVLSPIEGIGPDDLKIKQLIARVARGEIREVILATNPSMEGDATALYLQKHLEPLGVRVTRLARGLPVGGDLEPNVGAEHEAVQRRRVVAGEGRFKLHRLQQAAHLEQMPGGGAGAGQRQRVAARRIREQTQRAYQRFLDWRRHIHVQHARIVWNARLELRCFERPIKLKPVVNRPNVHCTQGGRFHCHLDFHAHGQLRLCIHPQAGLRGLGRAHQAQRTTLPQQRARTESRRRVLEKARARADEYAEEARATLDGLPDSEYCDSLRALPTYILDRDR